MLDLSVIYGNNAVDERLVRQNKDGLLRSEMRRNKEYPPGNSLICVKNRLPDENICYEYGKLNIILLSCDRMTIGWVGLITIPYWINYQENYRSIKQQSLLYELYITIITYYF